MTQDPKYGLPKLKKYPMPDAAHVRSAIKFFNYVTPSNEQELANAILARMDEYGISPDSMNVGDENRFKKYLTAKTELKHHGIKGQRWGVRRFQNPDGTLTRAGKRRERKQLKRQIRDANLEVVKKSGRDRDSAARQKIRADYEKAMNSDKMRLLRAEAKLAKQEEERIQDSGLYDTDKKLTESVKAARERNAGRAALKYADYRISKRVNDDASAKTMEALKRYNEEYVKVAAPFIDKYKDTVVKEMKFKDIEKGKKLMDEYNLWSDATVGLKDYSDPTKKDYFF